MLCEKRGYPCPDYEPEDVGIERNTDIMIDDKTIKLAMDLIGKSYAMDLLTNYIREVGTVNEAVVYAITGTYQPNQQTETYKRWWNEERDKTYQLERKIEDLQKEIDGLKQAKEAQEGAGKEEVSEDGENPDHREFDA